MIRAAVGPPAAAPHGREVDPMDSLTRKASRRRERAGWIAVLAVVAVTISTHAPPPWAAAHGGALELEIPQDQIAAGEELAVSGEGFTAGAAVALRLTGPGGDAALGSAVADDEGAFEQTVEIPGAVVPGTYLVRAEGDREATTELTVGAMAGMAAEAEPVRVRSVGWQAAALLLAGGIAVAGLALARTPSREADSAAA